MDSYLKHYIDGQWVESLGGARHEVISPSTEEPCTEITIGTKADVDAAVVAARRAFESFSQTSVADRLALLARIVEELKKRVPDLGRSMAMEMGAPVSFASTAQAFAGIGHFNVTARVLKDFVFEETIGTTRVVHEPMGVVGMITPWNWPLNQIALKVAPSIAAGNTMVLKPSEECPGNAAILAEAMHAAGVPAGVFNLVQGNGPLTGNAISSHPDIDMVSFTGSTRAGILIAKAAADTVKRVHTELGGKAANVVLPDADFATHLPPTVQGIVANSGQSCIAPTRILVHKDREAEAVGFVKAYLEAVPVGDPMVEGPHIGPVVNQAQYEKIQGLIQSAIDEGATLETGGTGRPADMNRGYYVRPTLFSGVTPDMRIAQEEVFGPVATLMTYADEEEAVRVANGTPFGLSMTISGDPAKAALLAPKMRAGIVTINSWGPDAGAPFGGYKQSGNGRENGVYGLREFMEVKSVIGAPVAA
ncbi:MAG: aldehyde dehydrogenase family protein [Sphingomonas sp.]